MAIEYRLSYTAEEVNNKLNEIDQLSEEVAEIKALLVDGNEAEH